MAKKKSKKSSASKSRSARDDSSDTDTLSNDTSSVTSGFSCVSGRYETEPAAEVAKETEEPDEGVAEIDDFENKFDLVLDALQSTKSARTRSTNFESLSKAMVLRFCYDYLDTRKLTLQDCLEHSLKRVDADTEWAIQSFSLILITMGISPYCDDFFRNVYGQLERALLDPTAKPEVRSKCATALSLGCFITDYGMEKTDELLSKLSSAAFVSTKSTEPAVFAFQANCLDMFSFLVSIASPSFISQFVHEKLASLNGCLQSSSLPLRIAAGECIALLLELTDPDELDVQTLDSLYENLQALATDSQKSKSKKELREQRSNFRQILRTFDGDEYSKESVKFGQENLVVDSWKLKRYYDTFCGVLGSGLNLHLAQNVLLRDIFELGPVLIDIKPNKISKFEKNYINNINNKIRNIHRGRMRGKRYDADL